jgi:hypothetical protein
VNNRCLGWRIAKEVDVAVANEGQECQDDDNQRLHDHHPSDSQCLHDKRQGVPPAQCSFCIA